MKNSISTANLRLLRLVMLALLVCPTCIAHAEVQLPSIFADHMVVQRNLPIHVWGTATPDESISVKFNGDSQSTKANDDGLWSVFLNPEKAGGPFEMAVQGTNKITLQDVLVGDVWIAAGQSNMEFPMAKGMNRGVINETTEIAAANYPQIRLLSVALRSSEYPLSDETIRQPWGACTPATVAKFSAVAYYFARDLQQHEKVPIGIIDTSWGGTPAEAWVSLDALSANASLMPVFARRANMVDAWPALLLQEKKEKQEIADAKAAGKTVPQFWHWDLLSWRPAGPFNAMIAPLTPFPIKGALWYQAESNGDSDAVPVYGELFRTLIRDWRSQWGQGEFPFLFVQLPNFNSGTTWPELRQQQAQALGLKNTAMAVTIDVGDPIDIHPKDKLDVGSRLALAARAIAYGEQIEYSGPTFRQVTAEGSRLRIWFTHAHGGLNVKNGPPKGFEVAGADQKYFPAQATIDGSTLLVSTASVKEPMFVRYAWAPDPDCNLYNGAGLPASPFEAKTFLSSQENQE